MERKYEDYLLNECTKKGLSDRDKIKYIIDYRDKYNLTWKEISDVTGYTIPTLKSNLKLLNIPDEEFEALKELGFTQSQMKSMFNPSKKDDRLILGNILNKLSTITNPKKDYLPIIKQIETQIKRIKDIIERKNIQGD